MVPNRYFVLLLFSVTSFLRSVESSGQGTSSCRCGIANVRTTRIIGGNETIKNEFPWAAGLMRNGFSMPLCVTTIINSLYVLAHNRCSQIKLERLELAIGRHHTRENDEQMRVKVVRMIKHPDPKIQVTLLKLGDPIKFPGDNSIAPVCLPSGDSTYYEGKQAIVTGWGLVNKKLGQKSKVLMKLSVTVASHTYCKPKFKSKFIQYNASMHLCTKAVDGEGTDWGREGGSPLILAGKNNAYSVIGSLYLFRASGGGANVPTIFFSVVPLLPWIWKHTADGEFCSRP